MIDYEKEQLAAQCRGSFIFYVQFMFKIITKRDFFISQPLGRESHQITIARELTKVFRGELETDCLGICVPPRMGKSVLLSLWITWCYTHYPDCNFLYISYSEDLAASHTGFIKQIMTSAEYQYLFDVHIKTNSRAKDNFETTENGRVAAFGSAGSITGKNAGLPNLNRFSGAVIVDDPLKVKDGHSDQVREGVTTNYNETIVQRAPAGTPIILLAQRIHEADLPAHLQSGNDIKTWKFVNIQAIDIAGNALCPEIHPLPLLLEMQQKSPYVFNSQFQQDPVAAGGALYKRDDFVLLDEEPKMIATFCTVDTGETDKTWNDATVFSFWGIYHLPGTGNMIGLHWLSCVEIRIEPRDLEAAFLEFYADCTRHPVPPQFVAIEKKSTGVTLVSVVSQLRGLSIRSIERNRTSGSKSQRFIDAQTTIASKMVSISTHAKHKDLVLTHMTKITANNSHSFDDIADTCADAIKIVYIDKTIYYNDSKIAQAGIASEMNAALVKKINLGKGNNYGRGSTAVSR